MNKRFPIRQTIEIVCFCQYYFILTIESPRSDDEYWVYTLNSGALLFINFARISPFHVVRC